MPIFAYQSDLLGAVSPRERRSNPLPGTKEEEETPELTEWYRLTVERRPVVWFTVVERNTMFSLLGRRISDDEGEYINLSGGQSKAEQARRLQPRLFDVEGVSG